MEAIILVGLQASGKSSYYKQHFFNSHVRISNDLLRTRNRQKLLLEYCQQTQMSFVIDNTNISREVRAQWLESIRLLHCPIKCYYFQTDLERSLRWNRTRSGRDRIPDVGILAMHKKLEIPTLAEGFDELFYVRLKAGELIAEEWHDEV